MTRASQRKASAAHRRRSRARGLVRIEVQAPRADAGLIRALAEALRTDPGKAQLIRSSLERALADGESRTAFDGFGSDLPDEVFEGIFDARRERHWREVAL